MKNERPLWNEYFMKIAYLVSSRSTCLRRKVGAVIVRDNQILSTGYNGAPKGVAHCAEVGCLREKLKVPPGERHELCRGVHAEQNAIIQAAVNGTSVKDAVMYCNHQPCSICGKMIINAEIKTVYIGKPYPDKLAEDMFIDAGVQMILYDIKTKELKRII
ncbi:MAG: cytidine/deoxycytidylate deaminase family protein [Candidatus Cloacimonetes bacterium]|nr:cytidine/deoxycytidylate deaminase family protein [Candidatus Cloacimonadota bacterium]MBL7086058.1 cytidine/deoxycytidylate deaminase family protein [Candidatus Cloacimonadota bacterium]